MSTLAAPGLPPVIVGSRSAGDGRLFLNAGIDAHNAVLFAAEKPGDLVKVAPRLLVIAIRICLVVGVASLAAAFLPIDLYRLPIWVIDAWVDLMFLAGIATVGNAALEIGGAIRASRHSRAIKAWRTQLEGALHGHRELLVDLGPVALQPHGPDVEELVAALTQARARALHAGDGHALRDLEAKLLHALGAVARYAQDNTPGRADSAHHAVTAFERATIEHTAHPAAT